MKCPICLSKMSNITGNKIKTECGHCFHKGCINEWLLDNNNCPTCRTQLYDDSETYSYQDDNLGGVVTVDANGNKTLTVTVTRSDNIASIIPSSARNGMLDLIRDFELQMEHQNHK